MSFLTHFLSLADGTNNARRFIPRDEITLLLKQKRENEIFTPGNELIIFDTMQQHTWLIASSKNLYCVIDNLRDSNAKISWSVPISRFDGPDIGKYIHVQAVSKTFGTIGVLDMKVRKFSMRLYSPENLKNKVVGLIRGVRINIKNAASRREFEMT